MERSGLFALPTKDAVRSPADGNQGGAGADLFLFSAGRSADARVRELLIQR